jgi:hypothetical protein
LQSSCRTMRPASRRWQSKAASSRPFNLVILPVVGVNWVGCVPGTRRKKGAHQTSWCPLARGLLPACLLSVQIYLITSRLFRRSHPKIVIVLWSIIKEYTTVSIQQHQYS